MARSSRVVVGVLLCLFYPAWVQGLGQPARFLLWPAQARVALQQHSQVRLPVPREQSHRPWQALWQLRSALGALQEWRSECQRL
jgi:hypothetical protein